jgi:Iron-containing alcohol dehydrogenase
MKVEDLLKPFPIKEFHPFPRAMMGPGAHEMVGPEVLKMGFKKTLLMSSGLRGTDIVHNMAESLKYHGLEVVVYDQVESNPKDYNVMNSVKLYQEQECDSFISIGGGSTHDACKGARGLPSPSQPRLRRQRPDQRRSDGVGLLPGPPPGRIRRLEHPHAQRQHRMDTAQPLSTKHPCHQRLPPSRTLPTRIPSRRRRPPTPGGLAQN